MASPTQSPIKISMFVYRKEGMSEEEFHHHWTVKHPPIVQDWLKKYGIIRYAQFHTPVSHRSNTQELETFGPVAKDNMLQYDGVAEFLMPNAKCFDDARRDTYYKEHVQPDEEKFFDMSATYTGGLVSCDQRKNTACSIYIASKQANCTIQFDCELSSKGFPWRIDVLLD